MSRQLKRPKGGAGREGGRERECGACVCVCVCVCCVCVCVCVAIPNGRVTEGGGGGACALGKIGTLRGKQFGWCGCVTCGC